MGWNGDVAFKMQTDVVNPGLGAWGLSGAGMRGAWGLRAGEGLASSCALCLVGDSGLWQRKGGPQDLKQRAGPEWGGRRGQRVPRGRIQPSRVGAGTDHPGGLGENRPVEGCGAGWRAEGMALAPRLRKVLSKKTWAGSSLQVFASSPMT